MKNETNNTPKPETNNTVTFRIGTQPTTGMAHLTTPAGKARCGMARATRYLLSVEEVRQPASVIGCRRCQEIAQKEINKALAATLNNAEVIAL